MPDCVASRILNDWNRPRFHLASDAWLVEDTSGRVVGYEEGWSNEDGADIELDGYVHPDAMNRGIGTCLLRTAGDWMERRAAARATVHATVDGANANAHHLFEGEGFELARQFWRMEIELHEPPPASQWPAGLTVRPYVPQRDDLPLYAAVEAAFADHWGHVPVSYEEWAHGHDDLDPALCVLAVAGDEIAGAAIGTIRAEGGWVRTVAVRRPWRRRGLGLALLRHAFTLLYQRGIHVVGLGVDAQSLTGATRLYERAGMRVRVHYDTFAKTVEPVAQLPA